MDLNAILYRCEQRLLPRADKVIVCVRDNGFLINVGVIVVEGSYRRATGVRVEAGDDEIIIADKAADRLLEWLDHDQIG